MKAGRRCVTSEQRKFIDDNKDKLIDFIIKNKYYYWDMTGRNAIYLEINILSIEIIHFCNPVKKYKK